MSRRPVAKARSHEERPEGKPGQEENCPSRLRAGQLVAERAEGRVGASRLGKVFEELESSEGHGQDDPGDLYSQSPIRRAGGDGVVPDLRRARSRSLHTT